jgi:integrase
MTPHPFGQFQYPTAPLHVRLRLQRDAIDLLGNALRHPAETTTQPDDGDDLPLCTAPVR